MCIKQFIDWFNNDFLFIFEDKSYIFSKKSDNSDNSEVEIIMEEPKIEIIIEEPKIEIINAKKQLENYDDYSWDIL